jgi:hypothetical protein
LGRAEAMTATAVKPEQDTQMEPVREEYENAYDPRHVEEDDSYDEETGLFRRNKSKHVKNTAMMARAIKSDETIVVDNKYKNLPDYEYKDVTFKNNDGTTTTCTYAKKIDPNYQSNFL